MIISYRMAATAVALLIVSSSACSAPDVITEVRPIKRLFFTAEARTALDRQRLQNIQQMRSLQGSSLRLDGMVQRSSGKSTVWINGQAQNENEGTGSGVTVKLSSKSPGSAQIAPGDDTPTQLKVGESINRATGEHNTRLGSGLVITPATPGR